jgi:hypothetical protein
MYSHKTIPFIPKQSYRKKKIPTALRNQTWISYMGERFRVKCPTTWCQTTITPFTFEAGHNIPESRGGKTVLENLIPICSQCNKSMGNTHTFDTWCSLYTTQSSQSILNEPNDIPVSRTASKKSRWIVKLFSCFLIKN